MEEAAASVLAEDGAFDVRREATRPKMVLLISEEKDSFIQEEREKKREIWKMKCQQPAALLLRRGTNVAGSRQQLYSRRFYLYEAFTSAVTLAVNRAGPIKRGCAPVPSLPTFNARLDRFIFFGINRQSPDALGHPVTDTTLCINCSIMNRQARVNSSSYNDSIVFFFFVKIQWRICFY